MNIQDFKRLIELISQRDISDSEKLKLITESAFLLENDSTTIPIPSYPDPYYPAPVIPFDQPQWMRSRTSDKIEITYGDKTSDPLIDSPYVVTCRLPKIETMFPSVCLG